MKNHTTVLVLTLVLCGWSQLLGHGLSLEELADTPVVQTAKGSERVFSTPASSFIFGEEALTYLPVDSIPEMLRYAPGVQSLRSSNGNWGVGMRGVNSRIFSRVLFNVDEQNLYASLFSGLFGNQHDLIFQDIEGIEIVYGPGGGLWGSNAVAGLVNIVPKTAFETEGSILQFQAGSHNQKISGRTGWRVDDKTSARVWASALKREAAHSPDFDDDWESYRLGLQIDRRVNSRNLLTFSADFSASYLDTLLRVPDFSSGSLIPPVIEETHTGATAQVKWHNHRDAENQFSVQGWAGYSEYDSFVDYGLAIGGVEFRGHWKPGPNHEISLRAETTHQQAEPEENSISSFSESASEGTSESSASIEYGYYWVPDFLKTSVRASFTHDGSLDRVEVDPYMNVLFTPNDSLRFWFSGARAGRSLPEVAQYIERIRTSSGLLDADLAAAFSGQGLPVAPGQPFLYSLAGADERLEREEVISYEIGLRYRWENGSSLTLTGYHLDYDEIIDTRLNSLGFLIEGGLPVLEAQLVPDNIFMGDAYGFDASVDLVLSENSSILINYSFLRDQYDSILEQPSNFPSFIVNESSARLEDLSPEHQGSIWYRHKFGGGFRWDLGLRAGSTEGSLLDGNSLQADTRISWEPNEDWHLSIVGRNLLDDRTNEAILNDLPTQGTEVTREVYLELRKEF